MEGEVPFFLLDGDDSRIDGKNFDDFLDSEEVVVDAELLLSEALDLVLKVVMDELGYDLVVEW